MSIRLSGPISRIAIGGQERDAFGAELSMIFLRVCSSLPVTAMSSVSKSAGGGRHFLRR